MTIVNRPRQRTATLIKIGNLLACGMFGALVNVESFKLLREVGDGNRTGFIECRDSRCRSGNSYNLV